jgi:GntR family transcriptional regulator of arabinose operon
LARRKFTAEPHAPKYRQVLESLAKDILSGRYATGQKLPSEAALVQQFQTSRITVGRALRELTQRGMVERIAGSGTYVRQAHRHGDALLFGLIIPDLGRTEIFEPICRGIAAAPQASRHSLLWGDAEQQPLELCEQYIHRTVAGVFFAPLENTGGGPPPLDTNFEIVARLEKARVPIVLLDRCVTPYPGRCRHDLVGIDNRRAGHIAAAHLLAQGARRIAMLAYSGGASTVDARIAGFREAVLASGGSLDRNPVHRLDTIDAASLRPLLKGVDGFVCANDRTAGELMRALLELGVEIPRGVRIAGIDDVEYAS